MSVLNREVDQSQGKARQERLGHGEPGCQPILPRSIEHAAHRPNVRPLPVVDVVVEEHEDDLGENAEDEDPEGEALGIDGQLNRFR